MVKNVMCEHHHSPACEWKTSTLHGSLSFPRHPWLDYLQGNRGALSLTTWQIDAGGGGQGTAIIK